MARLCFGHIMHQGIKLHYYRTIDDKPPIVLLHGFSDNGLCWGRLALNLEVSFDLVMPDSRGHGLSEATDTGYDPDNRVEDIADLIGQLGLEAPRIVGHSMGADTAARLAARYPDLVSCLVLEDPPFHPEEPENSDKAWQDRGKSFGVYVDRIKSLSLAELMDLARKEHPTWDETEFLQWAKSKQQFSKKTVTGITNRTPWQEVVSKIKCPGLLVTADAQSGAIITPETAAEVSRLWKKVKVVHIPGAGHNIRRDQFEAYKNEVVPFLEKYRDPKPSGGFLSIFKKTT